MTTPTNKITLSNIDQNNLVIGKKVDFTVTLTSDQPITTGKKVTIKNNHSKNIQFDTDSVNLVYSNQDRTATAKFTFKILPGAQVNSDITFDVDTDADVGGVKFTSPPPVTAGKVKAKPVPNNTMDISKIDPNDLVIGQKVNFTVTLTSDQPITKGKKVTIENNHSKNIQFDADSVNLVYANQDQTATAKFTFQILPGAQVNSDITFDVDTDADVGGVKFTSPPPVTAGKVKVKPVPNNTMDISKIDPDDLVIGQKVNFTVTLTSDQPITKGKKVTIENNHSKNIQFDADSVNLVYANQDQTATAKFTFQILPGAQVNSDITFDVDTDADVGGVKFTSPPPVTAGKVKAKPVPNKTMTISINTAADLVIGQHVSFLVTLSSDTPIYPSSSITIKKSSISNNIQFDPTPNSSPVFASDYKTATMKLGFTVLSSAQDDSYITFDVETDATTTDKATFQTIQFKGKANEIDTNSLALFVENPVLKTIIEGDQPPSETGNFTPIYTTLRSKSGKTLAYTPVLITSMILHKMKDFDFKKADNQTDIIPEKIGPNESIMLASDRNGLVKFYLHPKLAEIVTLTLKTIILDGVADAPAKQEIYAVNYTNPGYMNSIGQPIIAGFSIGNLYSTGMKDFATIVNSYDHAAVGDTILFFVNGNYTGHSVTIIKLADQLNTPMLLPYSIFKENEPSEFSYAVIQIGGHALYSEVLKLNYIGGVPYEPITGVKREFEPCIVHASIGVGPDDILQPGWGNYINYDAIMKYPGYKYNGLFIEIIRSNNISSNAETNPVPLDITDITLTMYINSDNKSFQKTYTKQIPLAQIGGAGNGNPNSIFFHINYDDISGIEGHGYIYFDYHFYQDQLLKYSVEWTSNIETTAGPGETGD
ncbi:hypothetical protein [Xenorhabdus entomophaga]|uniref:hypothetical protein n=1 Tax=Xenorhabdus entomophaga TaxID=3136257 RepID=UPI0030F392D3